MSKQDKVHINITRDFRDIKSILFEGWSVYLPTASRSKSNECFHLLHSPAKVFGIPKNFGGC